VPPHHLLLGRSASGFATWVWRHGDLVCFLVSDMVSADETERFKEYFVRVRTATEPLLAY